MTLNPEQQEKYVADCQRALDMRTLHSNEVHAADEMGVARSSFRNQVKAAIRMGLTPSPGIKPISGGRDELFHIFEKPLPAPGKINRYILTSAQNNTKINAAVWEGLLTFAKHVGATILVSRYMYNTSAFGQPANAKPGKATPGAKGAADLWYDPAVVPFISDERIVLAPGLVWCGDMNIRPTAVDPLSGLESHTGRASGIFPHAKIEMRSIASGKTEATKFNYTTGTVTQRNYIQRKEGLKAEFHHAYGALLVEVNSAGNWWCRQLNADKTGAFYDLDVKVQGKKLTKGHRPESITHGDTHVAQKDPVVHKVVWGKGGMVDTLRPRKNVVHDVLDFICRGHHGMKDPYVVFRLHVENKESVSNEIEQAALFLKEAKRPWAELVVVNSNHHDHLLRWLREADWRKDPVNAEFYIEAQVAVLQSIRRGDKSFDILRWAVERAGVKGVRFLGEDESYIVCKRFGGGVEQGMHGHQGVNGARPSPKALTKTGRKANVAHSHSAGLYEGLAVAGTNSKLDLGYNKGMSSWSHSDILTYPNGKRAIITIWAGRYRA